jgi:hypothetical protein
LLLLLLLLLLQLLLLQLLLLLTLMLFRESKMTTVFFDSARSTADLSVPLVAFSCTVAAAGSKAASMHMCH